VVRIKDIMTRNVVSVAPETPFKDVIERLVQSDVSGLPVLDDAGQLVGIITEADVTSKEAYGGHRRRALGLLADVLSARPHQWATKATGWIASDVMTRDVAVCSPDERVRVVARRMLELGVKRMPVVQAGELVGIVSRQDVLRMFARPDAEIAAEITKVLATDLNRPDDCHVHCSVEGGVATLTGDVRYTWDEPVVVSLARAVEGVIEVVSQVHNREPDPRPAATGIVSMLDR
jgi:CBS domain-containing protein